MTQFVVLQSMEHVQCNRKKTSDCKNKGGHPRVPSKSASIKKEKKVKKLAISHVQLPWIPENKKYIHSIKSGAMTSS